MSDSGAAEDGRCISLASIHGIVAFFHPSFKAENFSLIISYSVEWRTAQILSEVQVPLYFMYCRLCCISMVVWQMFYIYISQKYQHLLTKKRNMTRK